MLGNSTHQMPCAAHPTTLFVLPSPLPLLLLLPHHHHHHHHHHHNQVFYELHAERERQGKQNEVAIVRLEQLAPFPFDLVCRELYR